MKDTKKIRLGKLNFYIIDDNYIKYLSQFDKQGSFIEEPFILCFVI